MYVMSLLKDIFRIVNFDFSMKGVSDIGKCVKKASACLGGDRPQEKIRPRKYIRST